MAGDIRFALRQLIKSPGFTVTALLTLTIGIGVNVAVFSVLDAIVLRPMAVPDLQRVMTVEEDRGRGKLNYEWVTAPNFRDWKQQNHVFEDLSLYRQDGMSLTGAGEAAHLTATRVTPDFFHTLRIDPFMGRTFRAEEAQPGHDAEALLAYTFWRTQFASDPQIVGKKIELDGRAYTVIGVMPMALVWPTLSDVYLPLALTPQQWEDRAAHNYQGVGRLRTGITVHEAQAQLKGIADRLQKMYPATNLGWSVKIEPLLDNVNGELTPLYTKLMLGGTLFVLLIVCANVANLQLARGLARRSEMAMRSALGAPRKRLLQQMLTENIVLSLLGAVGGIFLAKVYLHFTLISMPARVARFIAGWYTIHLNDRALVFSLLLAVGAGIVAGMAPALQALRVSLVDELKSGSRTGTGSSKAHRLRNLFAAAQIALAVALVAGAALMSKGMWSTLHFADRYHPQQVLTFSMTLPEARYATPQQQADWYRASLEKIRAVPGVRDAVVTTAMPYGDGWWTDDFRIEGKPLAPGKFDSASRIAVSSEFFNAFQIPILSGRGFNASDGLQTEPVAIVSRKLAELYFPGEDPLGRRIQMQAARNSQEPWVRIVGVCGDAAYQWVDQTPRPAMYLDIAQRPALGVHYAVMGSGNVTALAAPIRKTLAGLDAALPVDLVQTYDQYLRDTTLGLMYAAVMLAVDAGIALLLAAIGIFGVMANLVEERRREIGVRLALGARQEDVLAMILRRAAVLAGSGMALGLLLAVALARGLAMLLYGVKPGDPLVYAGVIGAISVAALVASWVPARRAAGVDPMQALRDE